MQAHERNKVDASAMEGVAGVLQDRIDEGTESLPMARCVPTLVTVWCEMSRRHVGAVRKMEESVNAARLIPAYDAEAQRPEDIYPLHNIIPELEWAVLDSLRNKLKNATIGRGRACYPMPVVIGSDSTSCLFIPRQNPSLKLCLCLCASYTVILPQSSQIESL